MTMTAPTMRTDLQPLCPDHLLPMLHCDLLLKPCYACGKPGCIYHYDALQGYFTFRSGERIKRDMRNWQQCPNDGGAMYIATVEVETSKRTWRCGQLHCVGSLLTEGDLKSNSAASSTLPRAALK